MSILSLLSYDIIPQDKVKYVYILAGAIVGGFTFGQTGSWTAAITWDIVAVFTCWATIKIAEPIGGYITDAFRFLFR